MANIPEKPSRPGQGLPDKPHRPGAKPDHGLPEVERPEPKPDFGRPDVEPPTRPNFPDRPNIDLPKPEPPTPTPVQNRKSELLELMEDIVRKNNGVSNIPMLDDYWTYLSEYRRLISLEPTPVELHKPEPPKILR